MMDVNRDPRRWADDSGRVRVVEGRHPSAPERLGYNLMVDGDWFGTYGTLDGAANAAAAYVRWRGLNIVHGRVVLHRYSASHLPQSPCPRCGAADTEPVDVPRPLTPGDPLSIKCTTCGATTSLNMATGEWNLPNT